MDGATVRRSLAVKFEPDRASWRAIILGLIAVILSVGMNFSTNPVLRYLLRDVCQIMLVGVAAPLILLGREGNLGRAGLRFDRPWRYLAISSVLGAMLAWKFISQTPDGPGLYFRAANIGPAVYIMTANLYEVIFFFVFLRFYLEKSFGLLPGILMAAAFYSLHHAGFQPKFLELFLVGLGYIAFFRIFDHWLVCFPLWWVGGLGDLLGPAAGLTRTAALQGWRALPILALVFGMLLRSCRSRPSPNRGEESVL
jgi:hypothetical protein